MRIPKTCLLIALPVFDFKKYKYEGPQKTSINYYYSRRNYCKSKENFKGWDMYNNDAILIDSLDGEIYGKCKIIPSSNKKDLFLYKNFMPIRVRKSFYNIAKSPISNWYSYFGYNIKGAFSRNKPHIIKLNKKVRKEREFIHGVFKIRFTKRTKKLNIKSICKKTEKVIKDIGLEFNNNPSRFLYEKEVQGELVRRLNQKLKKEIDNKLLMVKYEGVSNYSLKRFDVRITEYDPTNDVENIKICIELKIEKTPKTLLDELKKDKLKINRACAYGFVAVFSKDKHKKEKIIEFKNVFRGSKKIKFNYFGIENLKAFSDYQLDYVKTKMSI